MEVPGQVGWTLTGDKTYEFARTPLEFIDNRILKYNSRIFVSRVLNKPTVFVTSNTGVKDILIDKSSSFNMGYKDLGYMHALYGDLFIFEDDDAAHKVRNLIRGLFHERNCDYYMNEIKRLTDEKLSALHLRSSTDVYDVFKDFSTALCLSLFLDVDDRSKYHTIKSAATTHWHGLMSVPVNLKVKGWTSSFSKASEAKEFLLDVIHKKLENNDNKGRFLQCISEAGFQDSKEAANHILLFISAIIPKALSSLLTSFVVALADDFNEDMREKMMNDEDYLSDVLLEVQRLWPPLYGGRRYTIEEVIIDGYKIPKNHSVAYITKFANRDPKTFRQAEQFLPGRWQEEDSVKRNLVWTFGGGARSCVGIHLIDGILKYVAKYLLLKYEWSITGDKLVTYKTLPVARPKEAAMISFASKFEAPFQ